MGNYFYALLCLLFWFGGLYLLMRPQLKNDDAKRAMVARDSVMDLRAVQRGTPVIGPQLEWTEQQPSFATWKEENERTNNVEALVSVGIWMAIIDMVLIAYNWRLGGFTSFDLVGILMWAPLLIILPLPIIVIVTDIRKSKSRSDGDPVPIAVRRRASVEVLDHRYFFVVESHSGGRPWQLEVFKSWDDIGQFGKADYWRTFGDTGSSVVAGGWTAVVMAPAIGRPWLISSTIDSDSYVYELVALLNTQFGAAAREEFLRAANVAHKPKSVVPMSPLPTIDSVRPKGSEVPGKL